MSGQNENLGAFVTTFRRPGLLAQTLRRLLEQSHPPDRILVVDNAASPETEQSVIDFGDDRLTYRPLDENRGPAGAAALAIPWLLERGAEWIYWGDDDNPPSRQDLMERLLGMIPAEGDERIGALAAQGIRWDWRRGRGVRVPDLELRHGLEIDAAGGGQQLLVHRRAVAAAGLPDERLFWGLEDYEYCLRIRRAGLKILCDGELMHEARKETNRLGFHHERSVVPRMSKERLCRDYYTTRNYVFLMSRTFGEPRLALRETALVGLRCLAAWARGPAFGFAFMASQTRALADGWIGRMRRTIALSDACAKAQKTGET